MLACALSIALVLLSPGELLLENEPSESSRPLTIPTHFDARLAWPQCSTIINTIIDQGSCGSCWAVSSAASMSDRLCIASKGRLQVHISPADLLQCCPGEFCSTSGSVGGCYGGHPLKAWEYFTKHGLTTASCTPYPVPPCPIDPETGVRKVCFLERKYYQLEKCTTSCLRAEESQPPPEVTNSSKPQHFGSSYYYLPGNVTAIQLEILQHGPVVAAFYMYDDLLTYKSGVYITSRSAKYTVRHAVRVLGWGVENGTEYWLAANSWNTDWGDLGGMFKIRRGINMGGFEEDMVAGMVSLDGDTSSGRQQTNIVSTPSSRTLYLGV